jgi:hypothetical protein
MDNQQPINCGITYDPHNKPQIIFYVKQYFNDFKLAFEKYRNELKTETSGFMLKKFEDALRSINSSLIGMIGGSFGQDVSGRTAYTNW